MKQKLIEMRGIYLIKRPPCYDMQIDPPLRMTSEQVQKEVEKYTNLIAEAKRNKEALMWRLIQGMQEVER